MPQNWWTSTKGKTPARAKKQKKENKFLQNILKQYSKLPADNNWLKASNTVVKDKILQFFKERIVNEQLRHSWIFKLDDIWEPRRFMDVEWETISDKFFEFKNLP